MTPAITSDNQTAEILRQRASPGSAGTTGQRSEPRGSRQPLGLLFLCVLAVYLLGASGYIAFSDGASMIAVTGAFFHLHMSVPCDVGVHGINGLCFSKYGPAWSIVAIPFYASGLVAERLPHPSLPYSLPTVAAS